MTGNHGGDESSLESRKEQVARAEFGGDQELEGGLDLADEGQRDTRAEGDVTHKIGGNDPGIEEDHMPYRPGPGGQGAEHGQW